MQITKSVLCLWLGCSFSTACCTFVFGALHVLKVAGNSLGGDGPQNISINFPMFQAAGTSILAAVVAAVSLLVSWRWNKQALFSLPHAAALLFLLPLALALFLWQDV